MLESVVDVPLVICMTAAHGGHTCITDQMLAVLQETVL